MFLVKNKATKLLQDVVRGGRGQASFSLKKAGIFRFAFFFSSSSFPCSPLFFFFPSFRLFNNDKNNTGRNDGGQLGVGTQSSTTLSHPRGVRRWAALALSPGPGSTGSSASSSSSSSTSQSNPSIGHAAGIDGSGDVYTWGRNDHGQLGVPPETAKRDFPMRMSILKGWDVRAIACGCVFFFFF